MVGFTFFSASMWSGGQLGQGMSFSNFLLAVLVGNCLLGGYTAALAYMGSKTGLSTPLLAEYAFGKQGSKLITLILSLTQVGWFGVGVAMFALPVNKVLGIDTQLVVLLSGALMTATAFFGFKALTILSFIAVPAIAILGGISIHEAVEQIGGFSALLAVEPKQSLGFIAAISICIGSFISGGTLTADFTRFAKTPKIAVLATVIAFFIGNSLMFGFGAIGAMATGESDIAEVMFLQGLIIPAVISLGLNIWTTNDNALYVSGLGFANITGKSKNIIVMINGALGTLAALWLYDNFVNWLSLLNSALPPVGAILLADYFLVHQRRYGEYAKTQFEQWNMLALLAWVTGIVASQVLPGIAPLNAVLVTTVMHVVLQKFALARNPAMQAST